VGALHIRSLQNERATRASIIAGFREHLASAGKDDVALFYYCGHGSQEPAPEEFWHLEPDRMDETLVCYDSRQPGQWDLADKELGKLINDLASRAGRVLVILDCCHSGSGTHGEDEIIHWTAKDDSPLNSFLDRVAAAAKERGPQASGQAPASMSGREADMCC
jgi:uncharacterized caspase-like protein